MNRVLTSLCIVLGVLLFTSLSYNYVQYDKLRKRESALSSISGSALYNILERYNSINELFKEDLNPTTLKKIQQALDDIDPYAGIADTALYDGTRYLSELDYSLSLSINALVKRHKEQDAFQDKDLMLFNNLKSDIQMIPGAITGTYFLPEEFHDSKANLEPKDYSRMINMINKIESQLDAYKGN